MAQAERHCEAGGKVLDNKPDVEDRQGGGQPRQCRHCGRAFVRQTALEAHETRCSSSVARSVEQVPGTSEEQARGRVSCPVCAKTFTLARSMREHLATLHGSEPVPRPYACDTCGRSFVRANLLAVHRRTHTGDRPFQCEVCGRRFICRGELNKHHRLHVDGYMYKCQLCGKETKTSRESADHRRQHAGGIVCPICGKSFTRYLNMKAHVRGTHAGERRFVCAACGKSFVYAQNLRYHRRVHGPTAQQQRSAVVEKPRALPLSPALSLLRGAVQTDVRRDDASSSAAVAASLQ